jgi:hypothetical protein
MSGTAPSAVPSVKVCDALNACEKRGPADVALQHPCRHPAPPSSPSSTCFCVQLDSLAAECMTQHLAAASLPGSADAIRAALRWKDFGGDTRLEQLKEVGRGGGGWAG